jgi:signal peptidase II
MKKRYYGLILLVILVDQVVKALIRGAMDPCESVDVIGSILSFTYVQNTGAAFSMFKGMKGILMILPLICCVIGLIYMNRNTREHWTMYLALSMIIGGGISNLIDRFIFGFVTDMFDVHFWPVFNVADIAICVGCGILVIYILFFTAKGSKEQDNNG